MTLDAEQAAAFADALIEAGAISVDITDASTGTDRERPIFLEADENASPAWEDNRLTALFAEEAELAPALARASFIAGAPLPELRLARLEDRDWVGLTQSQFTPIRVGARLWIVPGWHTAPDPSAINVVLDPGVAFGTGAHPTTRLCLAWLESNLRSGESVIDYGCGSGILAVAAAKLGAGRVVGVDIDAQALEASRYNAARNGVSARFIPAQAPAPEAADVVVANILSSPLKILAPLLAGLVRPRGRILLSGILAAQVQEMVDIYSKAFDLLPPTFDEGWARIEGARRA